jgi:hypothetical protein
MSTLNAETLNPELGLKLPVYTTTQRNLLTPEEGQIIFNDTTKLIEFYDGDGWVNVP